VQVVDQDADPALECRGRADHALGLVEDDSGLIPAGGGRVDLGALLAVRDQQVKTDPGRKRRLAVLARHRAIRGAEAPQAIRSLPPEQNADHERLPASQREGLPGPLALGVAQEAEERDRVARGRMIKPEPSSCGRA
jgi:hypothetical protein